jgi:hypothetical protein
MFTSLYVEISHFKMKPLPLSVERIRLGLGVDCIYTFI